MPTAYVTVPQSDAEHVAKTLVEERLAACVNSVPCTSTYRWQDDVHYDDEAILFVKTTDERFDDMVERVESLHPYEVPCIERIDESDCIPAFVDWRDGAVK